ncbi:hypothetical protein AYJ66_16410 [Dietzia cinnamea]|nr:hypothetical protein AYJ66_16410 [Dietzia cinnamea]
MGVVIVLALVTILTALRTELPRSPGVMSDALGPDPGERVGDYLDRAAASLVTVGGGPNVPGGSGDDGDDEGRATGPDAHRWALVSAGGAWSVAEAAGAVRDLPRVSGLSVQVPVEGVAMPVTDVALAEPVAGEAGREAAFGRGLERAAARLDLAPAGSDRVAAAAALTASRIRAGEPAIIGLLVRGTTGQLRAVADHRGVRAVEALPPDAVYGRFAVQPLLPQQVEAALPLPDAAPVPPA